MKRSERSEVSESEKVFCVRGGATMAMLGGVPISGPHSSPAHTVAVTDAGSFIADDEVDRGERNYEDVQSAELMVRHSGRLHAPENPRSN